VEYLKLDPDIDSDPAIMSAGWWGARFYELLLRVSARKDLKGRIPPEYQNLTWLARIWNLDAEDIARMQIARDAALDAGLIRLDGGDWILKGWEKFYSPAKSGAQRQSEYEGRIRDLGSVYFVECGVTGRVKIGTSANPGARFLELQTGSPTKLLLLGSIPGGLRRERELQKQFKHLSVGGEWFAPDPELTGLIRALTGTDAADAADKTDATSLHSTSHHSTSQHVERAAPEKSFVASIPEKPERPDDEWGAMDFWAWAQAKRREEGLPPERRPNERAVSAWWSAAQMQGVTAKQLRLAFVAYGNDPYWTDRSRKPPVPFGGFVSQWERFVEPGEASHAG
jgi:hypothetical protein